MPLRQPSRRRTNSNLSKCNQVVKKSRSFMMKKEKEMRNNISGGAFLFRLAIFMTRSQADSLIRSPFREANNSLTSIELQRPSLNQMFHYHPHNSPPLIPHLNPMNPVYFLSSLSLRYISISVLTSHQCLVVQAVCSLQIFL